MTRTLAITGLLLCGLWIGCSCRHDTAGKPPAPDAEEAPRAEVRPPAGTKEPPKVAKPAAEYHWPPSFKLPLQIHIDTPPVPPEIQRPSSPIKDE